MPKEFFDTMYSKVFDKLEGLDKHLTYHRKEHTLDVLYQCERIAYVEGIEDEQNIYLLKTAALYHDCGFLHAYADHETKSCELFLHDARGYGLSQDYITVISNLINATRVPQKPVSFLEQIICDADLDYLGRDDFFEISHSLREEFLYYKVVADTDQWEALQLKFLHNHRYHTASSRLLREPVKQAHLVTLTKTV